MTADDILNAIGDIEPIYLEEAKGKPKFKRLWICVSSVAACFFLFFVFQGMYYQQYLLNYDDSNYAPEAYEEFFVYYVEDGEVKKEKVGVFGGDMEMFDVWKSKNGIGNEVTLHKISSITVNSKPAPESGPVSDENQHRHILRVTVSASLAAYPESEGGELLSDCLKKTIASYWNVESEDIELVYV